MQEYTIAAIATPMGAGGIGIVRLSGARAIEIGQAVFKAKSGRMLSSLQGYQGLLGTIYRQDTVVDEAIVYVYRAPKSYTGEDVVEISCHGGMQPVQAVLRLCLECGARPAGPGEFTRRAFLNGKMDLSQAEAVMDVIHAHGEAGLKAAVSARNGALSQHVQAVVELLVSQSAHLAAWADYPDEDMETVTEDNLTAALKNALTRLDYLLDTYDRGRVVREGVDTVLAGKPNVGKSTIMNLLAGQSRSIVTDIPGTTRDVVEDVINLGSCTLRLSDTAGIRQTEDVVEQAGVALAKERLESAQLVLAVFDISNSLDQDDIRLLELLRGRPAIGIVNKTDLDPSLDISALQEALPHLVFLSALEGTGRQELEREVVSLLSLEAFDPAGAMVANERQRQCIVQAAGSIREALEALGTYQTLDAVNVCIDYALEALLSLTGEKASERVIEEVFSRFCVGK